MHVLFAGGHCTAVRVVPTGTVCQDVCVTVGISIQAVHLKQVERGKC